MESITEKLINLGFSENKKCFEKYVQKLGDRFGYSIIYDKEQGAFLFIKYTRTEKIIDEEEIMLNHNNLSSGIKEEWLRIKKELESFKIKYCHSILFFFFQTIYLLRNIPLSPPIYYNILRSSND